MNKSAIFKQIEQKKSYLCVGLDTDINIIPDHLKKLDDPVFEFNKAIIDATLPYSIAYKPNIAFYESMGSAGWQSLEKTLAYLPAEVFTIADAKRGDIGNTSKMYARAFFDQEQSGLSFDSITVAPYMGEDSVKPFLQFKNKWVILLALTSNQGSINFQHLKSDGIPLYQNVLQISQQWGGPEQMMYVVGATQAEKLAEIRKIAPEHFLLVPGVGAQGGDLEAVSKYGFNSQCGLLVNSSRGIIYASGGKDFAAAAGKAAHAVQQQMSEYLSKYGVL
jgi:orotidine-5'-phosphate decarboxylase